MYIFVEDEYIARIPPELLGEDYDKSVLDVARTSLEGRLIDVQSEEQPGKNVGKCYILSITDVKKLGEGAIVHGDGGVYQTIRYKALGDLPEMKEIVEGIVN